MTTVKELRDVLESCGYEADDLKDMKKSDLVEIIYAILKKKLSLFWKKSIQ